MPKAMPALVESMQRLLLLPLSCGVHAACCTAEQKPYLPPCCATDLAALEAEVRAIHKDGLLWGAGAHCTLPACVLALQLPAHVDTCIKAIPMRDARRPPLDPYNGCLPVQRIGIYCWRLIISVQRAWSCGHPSAQAGASLCRCMQASEVAAHHSLPTAACMGPWPDSAPRARAQPSWCPSATASRRCRSRPSLRTPRWSLWMRSSRRSLCATANPRTSSPSTSSPSTSSECAGRHGVRAAFFWHARSRASVRRRAANCLLPCGRL